MTQNAKRNFCFDSIYICNSSTPNLFIGNLLGSIAEAEAEEEQLAASVGIHLRGESVFRDEKLRNEKDDSRFHWHR